MNGTTLATVTLDGSETYPMPAPPATYTVVEERHESGGTTYVVGSDVRRPCRGAEPMGAHVRLPDGRVCELMAGGCGPDAALYYSDAYMIAADEAEAAMARNVRLSPLRGTDDERLPVYRQLQVQAEREASAPAAKPTKSDQRPPACQACGDDSPSGALRRRSGRWICDECAAAPTY